MGNLRALAVIAQLVDRGRVVAAGLDDIGKLILAVRLADGRRVAVAVLFGPCLLATRQFERLADGSLVGLAVLHERGILPVGADLADVGGIGVPVLRAGAHHVAIAKLVDVDGAVGRRLRDRAGGVPAVLLLPVWITVTAEPSEAD
ncbi:hypothetical protein CTP10_R66890 (plasmid) [Cupriavidus sp. P-10]|uniref:hypothetical protein n=1 Tax=Cupriavidus sp. P-10 TaxID=2027911 RepID=UPI000E2FC121|nr:hypothetical protein [Cupriavidus sp. P-10]BDB29275.1 hypothetical protein CTP10_R66890 [Cupriavidus sp. P-10]